jgi:hypothetical protein
MLKRYPPAWQRLTTFRLGLMGPSLEGGFWRCRLSAVSSAYDMASFNCCTWDRAKNVVKGFGDMSLDNQRIITMEWINEGATLIFIGVLTAAVTLVDPTSLVAQTVYWLAIGRLVVLSIISLFTGFTVNFLPWRLCPIIFTGSAILIFLGMYA